MKCPSPQDQTEFALGLVRVCSARLKQIDLEVCAIGIALKQGRLAPNVALAMIEDVAPGCVDAVFLSTYHGVPPEEGVPSE